MNKWMFRLKHDEKSSQPRYKARLIVKGWPKDFSQVVKMSSVQVVLWLIASMDLEIEQLDVKTTFFHGDLEEEICMEQLEGL